MHMHAHAYMGMYIKAFMLRLVSKYIPSYMLLENLFKSC